MLEGGGEKGLPGLCSQFMEIKESTASVFSKGPSINNVSSEGEGGGPPSKPIYYISLFINLSRQGEGGVDKFGKMG